jgi:hypothetical protein
MLSNPASVPAPRSMNSRGSQAQLAVNFSKSGKEAAIVPARALDLPLLPLC